VPEVEFVVMGAGEKRGGIPEVGGLDGVFVGSEARSSERAEY
jgi:hypothetical protein